MSEERKQNSGRGLVDRKLVERVVGKPSETDPIKFKISSKTSRGKKDSTKRHHQRYHKRQPGEQQFPTRWSPASLTFNNYFYLLLYICITRITINNNAPHLKSPKNQNYDGPNGSLFISILLHSSEFLILNSEFRNLHCEFWNSEL